MVTIRVYDKSSGYIEASIQNINDVVILLGSTDDNDGARDNVIILTEEEWLKICKHIERELGGGNGD
jgi:hypothetical protein